MKKLDLMDTYIIIKKETIVINSITKTEIKEAYTNVSRKDIKELEKKVNSLNKAIERKNNTCFQISSWYYLIKLSNF